MKEKILEMTNEELRKSCYLQRKICEMEEKHLFKEHLLLATQRVLDARDAVEKTDELDNKDEKNKKIEELQDLIMEHYLSAVTDLMDIVYSLVNEPPFCFLFEEEISLDDYIVLEMEDMVLINGFLRELKSYNSNSIDIDTILMALNESIFDYINCIKNEEDYSSQFEENYVDIKEGQEDKDE